MVRTWLVILIATLISCNKENTSPETYDALKLEKALIGSTDITSGIVNENIPVDRLISIHFSSAIDINTAQSAIHLSTNDADIPLTLRFLSDNKTIVADHPNLLLLTRYKLTIGNDLLGELGEKFDAIEYDFITANGTLKIESINIDGVDFNGAEMPLNISTNFDLSVVFSHGIDPSTNLSTFISLKNQGANYPLEYNLSENGQELSVTPQKDLDFLTKYRLDINSDLTSEDGFTFSGFFKEFYTALDSTYKFPEITDEELLTKVQEQTFKYFWDFGHPVSGLARERNTSGNLVTIGGSGFGIMAILTGIERGFITRQQGIDRLETIVNFLGNADRFHGVWPHWMDGSTGKTIPFSADDNGADLVETSFMIQGLLTARQYLNTDPQEVAIKNNITALWEAVEWDWFTQGGQDVLYWHWSPTVGWKKNLQIRGWNESLIVYVLAASSPTHPVDPAVYHKGWARDGGIANGKDFYNIKLPLGSDRGGPLFFAHYSFLGLDPRNLQDQYANYMEQNRSHALINRAYVMSNPLNYVGYGANSWGLTASDNQDGYSAHSPNNDKGVITPTAALASIPYTPEESMAAIRHFYYLMGDKLWGEYGFYDAYNVTENWYANSYLAIDQGPIIVMIENYRSGLLWDNFMSNSDITNGLNKLGFTY